MPTTTVAPSITAPQLRPRRTEPGHASAVEHSGPTRQVAAADAERPRRTARARAGRVEDIRGCVGRGVHSPPATPRRTRRRLRIQRASLRGRSETASTASTDTAGRRRRTTKPGRRGPRRRGRHADGVGRNGSDSQDERRRSADLRRRAPRVSQRRSSHSTMPSPHDTPSAMTHELDVQGFGLERRPGPTPAVIQATARRRRDEPQRSGAPARR